MRKIFVSLATVKLNPKENFLHFARQTYLEKLIKYGKFPILVPSILPLEQARELYAQCDGVLFMGGGDFNPVMYGEDIDEKTVINNDAQDIFELEVLKWVLADKKNFLGICRGCQALAIASGGSLYQHIPVTFPLENHGFSEGGISYADIYDQVGHKVNISKESHIYSILQKETILTNTAHHQSVKTLGPNFSVSGKTDCGVIEIIEAIDPQHFCFGIQSHPENFKNDDSLNILLNEL